MPVDVNRVKGELKKLFPKVNLSTKRLDEISARLANKPADDADDAAIAAIINDANDFMPFADIAKEDDRIRTLEANQKPKPGDNQEGSGGEPGTPPTDPKEDENMPGWAKKMVQQNETFLQEIETLKKGNVIQSKKAEARKLFEQNETFKGLSEKAKEHYLNQLKFEDDGVTLEDQVTGLEEVVKDIVQSKADSTQLPGKPPSADFKAFTDKDMDRIISNVKA